MFVVLVGLCATSNLKATVQQPDILLYNNDTLYVDVGWGHPSPLETYFIQSKIAYPFTMLSTGNYRGHVAIWELRNSHLYLERIMIGDVSHAPGEFVKSEFVDLNGSVAAKWFTGFILSDKYEDGSRYDTEYQKYFYIRNGELVSETKFTKADYDKIREQVDNGIDPSEIENIKVLLDYEKYVAYYFRLHDEEEVLVSEEVGYITGPRDSKLILDYFNNDHFKWPYNWKSETLSGVPIGSWKIIDNEVFLSSIRLHSGLGFYEVDEDQIEISDVFDDKVGQFKAEWLNGYYLIQFRKDEADKGEFDLVDYEVTRSLILYVKNGKILEQCEIESDVRYQELDATVSKRERELVQAYLEQNKW